MDQQRAALRLGWLGTGRMGSELVRRLASGCDVVVCNRTRSKAEALAAAYGVTVAAEPAELGGCDIVFTTVASSADLITVLLGASGLVSGPHAPRIVVDCSTVSPEASQEVRTGLAKVGTDFLAAPVMGNPRVAAAGRLTLVVSGPRAAYDTARPYLDMLGAGSTYVGEGELARTVKICHNLFLGVVAASLAEVTVLAQKSGISRETFLACLNDSVMGSMFTRYKTPAYVNADFHPTFTTTLLRKDFDLGMSAGRRLDVPLPVAACVEQLILELIDAGHGEDDYAALLDLAATAAGMPLVSENAQVSDGLDPVEPDTEDARR